MKHDVSTAAQQDEIRLLQTDASDVTLRIQQLEDRYTRESAGGKQEHEQAATELEGVFEQQHALLDASYTEKLEASRLAFEEHVDQLNKIRNQTSDEASRRRADEIANTQSDFEATRLQLHDSLQLDTGAANEQQKKSAGQCRRYLAQLEELIEWVQEHLDKRSLALQAVNPTHEKSDDRSSACIKRFKSALTQSSNQLEAMNRWPLSKIIDSIWAIFIPIAIGFLISYPVGLALRFERLTWLTAVLVTTIILTVVFRAVAQRLLVAKTRNAMPSLHGELVKAKTALTQAKSAVRQETESTIAQLNSQYQQHLEANDNELNQRSARAESDYANTRKQLETDYQHRYQELQVAWNQDTETIRSHFLPQLETCKANYQQQSNSLKQQFADQQKRCDEERLQGISEMQSKWQHRLQHFSAFEQAAQAASQQQRQAWPDGKIENWDPPATVPAVIPLGTSELVLEEGLRSEDKKATTIWQLPALLAFPNNASLLFKAHDDGRKAAIRVLQNVMLRYLVSIPAGKLRFTIFDPTGLGQNFSAFMHLADHDERLVNNRIWTEANQIQQRLTDLTEHMENVIQKYLRNEFQSIQEYNEHAGEVAEPFRVLVIANFPTHFTEESARRLISIVNSGARCGVYTLISVDTSLPLPRHIRLEDLQTHHNCLVWDRDRFHWEDETLVDLPLELDSPPDDETMTSMIKVVGRHAEDSNRVEVPFSAVTPARSDWWKGDCAREFDVPLGRVGATQQLSMKLGRGTSQHVLISGKTGSGKSTLLHALITNASLRYSPEQLQFYLIDFKKGVEFKPYADLRLPHARVVAIESEREFGLSVLQNLDEELQKRGELFRTAGVQSLSAYRETNPAQPMPRILLVVDEFQEFFVADDKVAHEASLLLDRLVRQGRAFGMHLILGSQTLAGAYSLARSTIGQMAVRIALQCSVADAHLILSEDNTAARLLGRPGEAIYNDANGLFEGNHPFQVVWLPDAERSEYLQKIENLAITSRHDYGPAIVFEGHAAADPSENQTLNQCLSLGDSNETTPTECAWLGAAVAIKDPTSVVMRPQSGSNLLIVGQDQDLALGMFISSLLSLSATRPLRQDGTKLRSVRFHVLDGEHDNPTTLRFQDRLPADMPLDINFHGPREAKEIITNLAEQIRNRGDQPDQKFEPQYVLIYDLARFRELKPAADDFGFSSFGEDEPKNPAGQLAEILRDGPALGVHVLIWADSYNNVTRWFERALLRDFAYRVLFQMSAVDSSNLMDSAAASHLGPFRALLYDDDRGQSEKFRPYGPPSEDYLRRITKQLVTPPPPPSDDDPGPTTSEANSFA
ncbi:MAG: FtsK/SpoIIIE domain-containing protein [Pirellulaceae bacterium]|nr:FtsK/SpoIIIE domain-containing protein [Pirellulaceae bacterium]